VEDIEVVENHEETRWLPIEFAAEAVAKSTKTLSRWITQGRVKWKRDGRTVLVDVSTLPGGSDEDPMVAMFSQIIAAMKQSHTHTERAFQLVERVTDSLSKHASQMRKDLAKADADIHESRQVVSEALDTASEREAAITLLMRGEEQKEMFMQTAATLDGGAAPPATQPNEPPPDLPEEPTSD
jgi:hypothetical protein